MEQGTFIINFSFVLFDLILIVQNHPVVLAFKVLCNKEIAAEIEARAAKKVRTIVTRMLEGTEGLNLTATMMEICPLILALAEAAAAAAQIDAESQSAERPPMMTMMRRTTRMMTAVMGKTMIPDPTTTSKCCAL